MVSIGNLISAGASLINAVTGLRSGNENSRISEEQARRERERTELELQRQKRLSRRIFGTQTTQFAAAGVTISGSAFDIFADSQAEAELDEKLIEAGGSLAENFALSQARNARREGVSQFQRGLLTSAATLLEDEF